LENNSTYASSLDARHTLGIGIERDNLILASGHDLVITFFRPYFPLAGSTLLRPMARGQAALSVDNLAYLARRCPVGSKRGMVSTLVSSV
jgi:hypothetical protein